MAGAYLRCFARLSAGAPLANASEPRDSPDVDAPDRLAKSPWLPARGTAVDFIFRVRLCTSAAVLVKSDVVGLVAIAGSFEKFQSLVSMADHLVGASWLCRLLAASP